LLVPQQVGITPILQETGGRSVLQSRPRPVCGAQHLSCRFAGLVPPRWV